MNDQANSTNAKRRLPTVLLAGTVAVIGALTVATAQAQDRMAGWGPSHGRFADRGIERVLNRVDATDEQQAAIREILATAREDIQPVTEDIKEARTELAQLLRADKIDRDAVSELRESSLSLADSVSERAMIAMLDAAEVLTPEQRATLLDQGPGFGRGFGPDWR